MNVILFGFTVSVCIHLMIQVWGRKESYLLWGVLFWCVALPLQFLPLPMISGLAIFGAAWGLTFLMGPWRRQTILIVNQTRMDNRTVKSDYENLVGVGEDSAVTVVKAPLPLRRSTHLKTYQEQSELTRDLNILLHHRIRYEVKTGLLTSVFVEEQQVGLAAKLLGVPSEPIESPSPN